MGNLHKLLACTGEEGRIWKVGVWMEGQDLGKRILGRTGEDLGGFGMGEGLRWGHGIGGVGGPRIGMGC
jgi:hypothetical protein